MAKYDRNLDYNITKTVSNNSFKDLSPDDTTGGLTDSGFETGDLTSSPTPISPLHESFVQNGKLSPDYTFFDPLVSTYRDNGDPPPSATDSNFLDLNIFDPLAPLPEEFPSPQNSSSPHQDLYSPAEPDLLRVQNSSSRSASPHDESQSQSESLLQENHEALQDYSDLQSSPQPDGYLENDEDHADDDPYPDSATNHVNDDDRDPSPVCESSPYEPDLLEELAEEMVEKDDFEEQEQLHDQIVEEDEEVEVEMEAENEKETQNLIMVQSEESQNHADILEYELPVVNASVNGWGNDSGAECDSLEDTLRTEFEQHVTETEHEAPLESPSPETSDPSPSEKSHIPTKDNDRLASIAERKSSFSVNDGANEPAGVKIDRARITRSFSQVMSREEKTNLCRICGRPVFLMDRIKAEKSVFHKGCFRCKECNKQLTVDSYCSHEGVLYCKLHFKQLFQPKVKFEEEGPRIPRKRHEMIIKENTPLELPPDVIRSSDKPSYGLDELPSLQNIKSRFEGGDESDQSPNHAQVAVKRSESILNRMAKFQSGNEENGHYEDSSSDEEEILDPDVVRETRKKEKVVFSAMTELKTQWESGSVTTKEEWARETSEELNKLRQRICQGKGNLKAVYENAVQESEKTTSIKESALEMEIREIRSVKEKWEQGDVLNDAEQEKLQKFDKEREDDLSVFKDSGNPAEARTLFKKIDETVIKSGSSIALKMSPNLERSRSSREIFFSNNVSTVNDADVVKCNDKKEDVAINPVELHQKFKFFENYQDQQVQERKRFTMTPPREVEKEDSVDRDVPRDPNIVRCCDKESDIPVTDTAKKMLNKFREMETQAEREEPPAGPKPMKRITPPREYTNVYLSSSEHESSPEPERDPNIVRCTDKIEDTILIEAEKTRSLRAKFERWEGNDVDGENQKNGIEDDNLYPSIDTTKNLKAKFEALRDDNQQSLERPKNKVNRFVENVTSVNNEHCSVCDKRVYAMEKMEANGLKFHKSCFKCSQCSCFLRLDNYTTSEGVMYCTPHFKQLFISKGNYDEGFGREQHKEKWNRSRSTTPTPKEFNGLNGNGDYYTNETEEMFA